MRCQGCHRFDADSENCQDKKLNPQTWKDAVQSAQIFGPRALCQMNNYRERILSVYYECNVKKTVIIENEETKHSEK